MAKFAAVCKKPAKVRGLHPAGGQNAACCAAALAAAAVYEQRPAGKRRGFQAFKRQVDTAGNMAAVKFTRCAHIYQNRPGRCPAKGYAGVDFIMLQFHKTPR